MTKPNLAKLPLADVYRSIYPWKSLSEFVDQIKQTVAYKSEDNSLIAINKPFGVGTYVAQDNNFSKQNQDKIFYKLNGRPRYCISDALQPLTDEFKSSKPYEVLKSPDRYMSGLTLITNDPKKHGEAFKRSLSICRINKAPAYGFRAITSGYPTIKNNKVYERVGVQLIEVDELGDHKEPIIVTGAGSTFVGKSNDKKTFQVELEVKKINKELSTALLVIYTSKSRWDFARCYISSKTSFILGDVRFSKRIKEILGKPIQVSAFRSSHRYDDSYEPLNSVLRSTLGVSKNASIPLMLDLHVLRLKGFDRKKKEDLLIESPYMPVHFALTAERLNLLDDLSWSGGGGTDYDTYNNSNYKVDNDNKRDTVAF